MNPATAQRRARRLSFLTAVALAATAFFVPASAAAAPPANAGFRDGRYIVTFVDAPVAEYDGYVDGYAATAPRAGRKLNAHSNAADRWSNRLTRIHDRALARVGASKIYDYTITNNGVAAQLTGEQAADLSKDPAVVAVQPDELAQPGHDRLAALPRAWTPATASGRSWAAPTQAGAGIVVGVIDTRHLAGERGVRRRDRHPGAGRVEGHLRRGRAVHREPVQRQARRRPLLRRGLRQEQHRHRGLPVAARRLRARLAHGVDRRGQPRHQHHHRRQR